MKKIKKTLIIGLTSILFFSGMLEGVSACNEDSPLYATQDILVGNVNAFHTAYGPYPDKLIITYTTTDGWYLTETHLAVAESLDEIPQTKSGNPKIGKFPYKAEHDPSVTVMTYYVDLNDFDLDNPAPGVYKGTLVIAAHAVVEKTIGDEILEETAWADTGDSFPGNSWALYFTIELW